jgi:hypothetical protein
MAAELFAPAVINPSHIIEEGDLAESSGGMGILGVVIGAAIVLMIGFFLLNGNMMGGSKSVDVNIKAPTTSSK